LRGAAPRPARRSPPASRIVFVLGSAGVGGTERQLLMLLEELVPAGLRAEVIVMNDGPLKDEFAALAPTRALGKRRPIDLRFGARLVRAIRHAQPDLVCAWGARATVWGPLAARVARVPRLVIAHRNLGDEAPLTHRLDARFGRWARAVVGNSAAVADAAARRGVPRDRLTVIHNGVRARRPRPNGERPGLIVLLGRIERCKGHDLLLRALATTVERVPGVSAVFGGAAVSPAQRELAAELSALRDRLGLRDRVKFAGHVEPLPLLSQAATAVVPSRTEGFPNVVLEAMSLEVPVVATAVGGIPEVIEDGRTGRLVPAEDQVALGRAIVASLEDRDGSARLARTARERVERDFTPTAMAEGWARVFHGALAHG
jgi:glycosyltransferase involved in cell wall biosynthesis